MQIKWKTKKTELFFKFPFVITHGTRFKTDALFLELTAEKNNKVITGYGEATIPPYLKETTQSVYQVIEAFAWDECSYKAAAFDLVRQVKTPCAQTIIEMALIDLFAKYENQSLWQFLNLNPQKIADKKTSYTLSLNDSKEEIEKKFQIAPKFDFYKIKLTGVDDRKKITTILPLINNNFMVDANMAWDDPKAALEMINFLAEVGCRAVEQPLKITASLEGEWLKDKSPIPIIADEAIQFDSNLEILAKQFHGINVKTLKFGGLLPSLDLIQRAKKLDLLIQVGCMSESSLGCTYALPLIVEATFIDLDGPLLIKNDPFHGLKFESDGLIVAPKGLGIGSVPINDFF